MGTPDLLGRRRERHDLDEVLRDVRAGHSRVLILRGEAGAGKTALLDHLAGRADGHRVLRAAGVESESEIAYSALQQLCAPLLDGLGRLPAPQRDGLSIAFGLSAGVVPELMVLGMATLGLFAEAAAARPVVCVIDNAQWLDRLSKLILAFVARRLGAESLALVFAARDTDGEDLLEGLPELRVDGLPEADARELLDAVLTSPVDARVRDRIVAETSGNPLALLELTKGLSPAELAFGFGGFSTRPLAGRIEEGFRRRIAALPADTRKVLLAAAVEPIGDAPLLRRAMEKLGVGDEAAVVAQSEGLIEIGACVRFPHPVVRSAAWRSGSAAELREVHAALAEVTDHAQDPDRRAWHRAHAAAGPDEEVARELELSAGRALDRGGRSAAAAFLERAAALTRDPGRRSSLLVSAARARFLAGSFALVPDLLAAAEVGRPGDLDRARIERLRAQVAFATTHGREAGRPLLAAATRLRELDPAAARDTFLSAVGVAVYAGRFGGDDLRRAAEAARGAWTGREAPDLLLAGLVSWVLDGRAQAAPLLCQAIDMLGPDDLGLTWLTPFVALELFRMDLLGRMSERAVRLARDTGTLSVLPTALAVRAGSFVYAGRLADAAIVLDEVDAVAQLTGGSVQQAGGLLLVAYRGREKPALEAISAKLTDAEATGNGRLHTLAHHHKAVLYNGLGNHRAALDAALEAGRHEDLGLHSWTLGELIEAAARSGEHQIAADARERLGDRTKIAGTSWALGAQAIADALAGPAEQAEDSYREAIERLSAPETAIEGYRARLLFGEWLRRASRRAEARTHLRAAHEAFTTMGAEAFADRAGRELAAAGEPTRIPRQVVRDRTTLTSQESVIARRAAAGQTNVEIGEALFLSPRTVEWHMRKIFAKLGILSRRDLPGAIGGS
ncbi:ATP-binding protein [Actinoplanes sp. CA-142083]|uniref:ATP-binding protein n=1 Tax=Actinoplanes sp. CA-142083 TaxID=3239903 RepID=UPI003D8C6100